MNPTRVLAITRRVLRGLRHDRRSVALIVVAPIMAMFVFGVAFSGNVSDIPLAVVNYDSEVAFGNQTNLSLGASIVEHLDGDLVRVVSVADNATAIAMVERGEARGAVIIPANFSRDVVASIFNASFRGNTSVFVRLDRSNVNVAADLERAVAVAMQEAVKDLGRPAPIKLDDSEPIYGKDAKFADFFIPGIMTFAVFLLTNLLTITGFVQERLAGTLDRLGASPLTEGELVLGYSLVALIQSVILITVAVVVFQITIVGPIVLAFLIVALLAIASQALGILLSAAARTEAQAVQFIPFLVFPVFLLSGIFWPVEAIPVWLRPLSWAVPTTYAVEGLRSVMIRGWGLERVAPFILALALFCLVFLVLARLSLKRSRR